jgi:ATP-dependent Lon protease
MDMALKALAISKVDQLAFLDPSSSEYHKMTTWVEHLCKLPIGKYQRLPISHKDPVPKIARFLDEAKKKLDAVVYGHGDAKDQIVRLLAKWISSPSSKGLVIGIEGVHGIGKTSLVKDGICQVLGLPFGFVTLGGISDGSYMVGHSYTYEGARWGKIADMLMKVGCMNPVLYFDELDKISTTSHGEEIANLMIHLTDSSQNDKFQDKYFTELDLDLSKALIIFSYNHPENINPILRDRMTVIRAKGYTVKDKVVIARDYMLPKILVEYGRRPEDVVFSDEMIAHVVSITEEEEGVRNLKRSLEEIVSQVNLHILLGKSLVAGDGAGAGAKAEGGEGTRLALPVHITKKLIDRFIHKKDGGGNGKHLMMYV